MSTDADRPSGELLAEAIVAFTGRGTRKIPTADEAAVFALDPERFDEVIAAVKAVLKVSDSIVVDESDRSEVKGAVIAKHRELLPDLDDRAIDALVWRWGYITFHG
ncbi:hypothetical protein [Microbacterium sp. P5_E9]